MQKEVPSPVRRILGKIDPRKLGEVFSKFLQQTKPFTGNSFC